MGWVNGHGHGHGLLDAEMSFSWLFGHHIPNAFRPDSQSTSSECWLVSQTANFISISLTTEVWMTLLFVISVYELNKVAPAYVSEGSSCCPILAVLLMTLMEATFEVWLLFCRESERAQRHFCGTTKSGELLDYQTLAQRLQPPVVEISHSPSTGTFEPEHQMTCRCNVASRPSSFDIIHCSLSIGL